MRDLKFYHELEDMYEEQLNECYETVSICGMNYDQGHALRQLDPIAFRCAVSDWVSEEFDELGIDDMTEAEIANYYVDKGTTMYCRKDENNIDDEEE